MKTTPEPATVLLVGGGSVIAPAELEGVGGEDLEQKCMHQTKTEVPLELIRPSFFSCANAVGACVANVAGDIGESSAYPVRCQLEPSSGNYCLDTIEILKDLDLSAVLERCKTEAMKRAVQAGARPNTVKVVEIENLPVQVRHFQFL
jgi:hypothetical protein